MDRGSAIELREAFHPFIDGKIIYGPGVRIRFRLSPQSGRVAEGTVSHKWNPSYFHNMSCQVRDIYTSVYVRYIRVY